jgi:hypothetical protein
MPSTQEHRRAFDELADGLRQSLQAGSHALQSQRGTPTADVLERHFEHTLDRLAHLYGSGTYENLSVSAIFASAVHGESLAAYEYLREARHLPASQPEGRQRLTESAERHRQRAHALINAARRGERLSVPNDPPAISPRRGVYVTPLTPEVYALLMRNRPPSVRWRDGAVASIGEATIDSLREIGAEATILFLDTDELHDEADKRTPEALQAEFGRRLAAAKADGGRGVGEPLARHINRLLLHQSNVLRNLQYRLRREHEIAHRAVQPILVENRRLLAAGLVAHPTWEPEGGTPPHDPFARTIALERAAQEHAAIWQAHGQKDDAAGLRFKFQYFVEAGTLLDELTRTLDAGGKPSP